MLWAGAIAACPHTLICIFRDKLQFLCLSWVPSLHQQEKGTFARNQPDRLRLDGHQSNIQTERSSHQKPPSTLIWHRGKRAREQPCNAKLSAAKRYHSSGKYVCIWVGIITGLYFLAPKVYWLLLPTWQCPSGTIKHIIAHTTKGDRECTFL